MEAINDNKDMIYRHRVEHCEKCGKVIYRTHWCESNPHEHEDFQRGFDRSDLPDSILLDDE